MTSSEGFLMDVKAKPSIAAEPKKRLGASYLQEFKDELKKITWTTKEELKFFTKVTVGATFILGIGIYLVDLGIKGFLAAFGNLFQFIFG